MSAKIVSIKIKVGEKELELTPDEARAFKDELEKLLDGKPREYVPYPVYPYWQPVKPYTGDPIWTEVGTGMQVIKYDFNTINSDIYYEQQQ